MLWVGVLWANTGRGCRTCSNLYLTGLKSQHQINPPFPTKSHAQQGPQTCRGVGYGGGGTALLAFEVQDGS